MVEEESGEEQLRSSKAVLLPKLQSIYIKNLPELKRFCKGYLVECPLLTRLSISECPQLKTFVSQECEQVRLGVEKNDQTAKLRKPLFDEMVVFPSLESIYLGRMISIEKIWHNQLAPGSFCKLKTLNIYQCEKLAEIFPPILILLERFQKLELLRVSFCDCVEEIFGVEGSNNADHISFQLKHLDLSGLAKLRHIWTEDSSRLFTFPNLCQVKIKDCISLRNVFPRPIAENLPELEELTVRSSRVDDIVAMAENGEEAEVHPLMWPKLKKLDIPDPLSLLQKVSNVAFPCLTNLSLEWDDTLAEIMHGLVAYECFGKLEVLELINLPNDHSLFYFLQRFPNIHELVLSNAHFEEIVTHDEAIGEDQHAKLLANLRSLKLSELSKLVCLTKEDTILSSVFQRLETLEVVKCSIMELLVPSFVSFQCLKTLEVSECNDLLCLITSAAAGTLMLLQRLTVKKCRAIEQIIPNEENLAGKTVSFSKLEKLELHCLPSLMSFSFWNCALIFPSLKHVYMIECPKLKIFSQGVVGTPELRRVYVQEGIGKSCWEGSLNATIQKIFSEMHEDQAVPMSNHAESSKQPNLNAEDAQQQNSGTCDVPEEDPTLNQNSATPLDIKDVIVLHPQVDPHATDEISNVLVPPAATEVASLSFSTSEDSHVTKNPDYWKDLFPEIQ